MSEKTGSLPASGLEKLDLAMGALTKLTKNISTCVGGMREHTGNGMIKAAFDKLCEHLSALRTAQNNIENVKISGRMPDKSVADCRQVLNYMGVVASSMEVAFQDVQAATGLLAGLKRS